MSLMRVPQGFPVNRPWLRAAFSGPILCRSYRLTGLEGGQSRESASGSTTVPTEPTARGARLTVMKTVQKVCTQQVPHRSHIGPA